MLNSSPSPADRDDDALEHERVSRIVSAGPRGALAVAGIATAIVVATWLAFYLFVFLPRGTP
jgi:uncharacterized membrane protein